MCGKSFPKKADEQNTNMLAEMFEAVWGAQFIDSKGDYARECHRPSLAYTVLKALPSTGRSCLRLQPISGCSATVE